MENMMITIPLKTFRALCEAEQKLEYLEGAGVDNWEGYDYIWEMMEDNDDTDIRDLSDEEFVDGYITESMISRAEDRT